MRDKVLSLVLLVVGIIILVVSLIADFIGIGRAPAGFGFKQILGTIIGAIVIIIGIVLTIKETKKFTT